MLGAKVTGLAFLTFLFVINPFLSLRLSSSFVTLLHVHKYREFYTRFIESLFGTLPSSKWLRILFVDKTVLDLMDLSSRLNSLDGFNPVLKVLCLFRPFDLFFDLFFGIVRCCKIRGNIYHNQTQQRRTLH